MHKYVGFQQILRTSHFMVCNAGADTHPVDKQKNILQQLSYIIVQLKTSEMKDSFSYDF